MFSRLQGFSRFLFIFSPKPGWYRQKVIIIFALPEHIIYELFALLYCKCSHIAAAQCIMYPYVLVRLTNCCSIVFWVWLRHASYGFVDWQDDWKLPCFKHRVGSVDLSLAHRKDCDDTQKEHIIKTHSQYYGVQQCREKGNTNTYINV